MSFTEFFADAASGSNLNSGSTAAASAAFTYASGSWVASTGVFTVASGNPSSDGVAVGDFASVYADGSSVTGFVGRVTARDSTTITVSLTAVSGSPPGDGTSNRTLKIGGAWKGPNAAVAFPFGFAASTMTNSSGYFPRINFKTGSNYAITSAMTHSISGPVVFAGYTTTVGDGGKFIIDGGTSTIVLLTISSTNNGVLLMDAILQNNGTSGSNNGLTISGAENELFRVVVNNVRGTGIAFTSSSGVAVECEAYLCNGSNTANLAGMSSTSTTTFLRCISHDNSGSNSNGFYLGGGHAGALIECIADTNGARGIETAASATTVLIRCDCYNNASDGLRISNTFVNTNYIDSCNFLKNGTGGTGWGINRSGSAASLGVVINCGFGAGAQANTSGTITGISGLSEIGSVIYDLDVTPWVDPANGDFRVNLEAASGTGRGNFTQTQGSYAGTRGYPDRGAATRVKRGTNLYDSTLYDSVIY